MICEYCEFQSFCMEGENKGKPGPCPEGDGQNPPKQQPQPKKSIRQRLGDAADKLKQAGKAGLEKAKQAGKAVGDKIGIEKIKTDFRKAKGLKLPEQTPGGIFLKGMQGIPDAIAGGMKVGKGIGEKALYGAITGSKQLEDTLNATGAAQLKQFRDDWGPALRGVQHWAKDPKNAQKLARATARVSEAFAGPYVRSFKIAQKEFGTLPAVAMSAAIGTSTHLTKPIQAAIFSATGIPLPSSLVNPIPIAVWGGAYATRWAIKTGATLHQKFKQLRQAHDEWYASGWGGPLSKNSESASNPVRAKIIAMMRQQRQVLENALEHKLPALSDSQLWAMFKFHLKRSKAPAKMSECPEKFCMEGPNKGKPGPCPGQYKGGRKSGSKTEPKAKEDATGPTNAAPGSEEKIKVMQARLAKGLPLFDPKDGSAPVSKPIDNQKKPLTDKPKRGTISQVKSSKPGEKAMQPETAKSVKTQGAIQRAYMDLNGLREYEDGPVPLPRIYTQVKASNPGLTVPEFHRELQELRKKGMLNLMVRNEVRDAPDADKAIKEGDNLLYYATKGRSFDPSKAASPIPVSKPKPKTSATAATGDVGNAQRAYDDLSNMMEYANSGVPLPRMFQKMKATNPTLTLDGFHAAVKSLAKDGKISLAPSNDPMTHQAEQGISEGGKLLYYAKAGSGVSSKPKAISPAPPMGKVTPQAKAKELTDLYNSIPEKPTTETFTAFDRAIEPMKKMTVKDVAETVTGFGIRIRKGESKAKMIERAQNKLYELAGSNQRIRPISDRTM